MKCTVLSRGGSFSESSPLAPNNPYAASKAASDCLVRAYHKTYGLNTNIARSTNNYGPCQHREKFIPATIYRALRDETVLIYGDGQQIREWLYVADHCSALEQILFNGRPGEVYNIGSGEERKNLELAGSILHILGKSSSLLLFVDDRPGHDRRYAVNSYKIRKELGWEPQYDLEVSLQETVKWYVEQFNK